MIKEKAEALKRVLLLGDGIIVSACFFISFYLRQHVQEVIKTDLIFRIGPITEAPSSISSYLPLLFFVVPLWCFFLYFNGIYANVRTRGFLAVAWITLKSAFYVAVGLGSLIFIFNYMFISRLFFVIFLSISSVSILVEKVFILWIFRYIREKGHNFERLLIVGTGKRAVTFLRKIQCHPEWGLKIVGILDDEPGRGVESVGESPITGNIDQLAEIMKELTVDEVIIIIPRLRLDHVEKAVIVCETMGVRALVAMDLFSLEIAKTRHVDIDGQPFVSFTTTVANESQLLIKRTMDILISGLAMGILGPFLLAIAALIKLTSSGGAIFRQQRAGLNGRKFVLLKFRTMFEGAEEERAELEGLNEMDGPVFKIRNDPRVTPLGRILRKFSIDELPQLYNVFVGQMSLIGPRALPTYEVEKMDLWQRRRLSMRPGITCLWQIGGRSKVSFDEWMKLDLDYLDHWSLGLDLEILAKTIPAVIFGIGAY